MVDPTPNSIPEDDPQRTDVEETFDQRPESTIFGDHELLDEIARGGMGIVYRARQMSLDRIVALKLIISGHEASDLELGRFEIEAKAAARLDHPYIVPVYSFGKMYGQSYFTMGFVEGLSLATRLAREGAMPPNDAAELIKLVAYALDYAHSQNVVHRDIKPGNVLIDEDGNPRVTDFGLAKRQDVEQGLTGTGQVLGTPTYMAPEQATGEEVGPAADIYSLGATLYATLTGGPPFEASSLPELLLKIADELPVAPRVKNTVIPEALSQITMRCLAKRPGDRYASAKKLAEDLERFQAGQAIVKHGGTPKRSRWATAATLLLLPILGLAAWALMGNKPASESPQETTAGEKLDSKEPPLTPIETQLLAALDTAMDGILPTAIEGPWLLRYEESAKAFQQAFETAGIDVFKLDSEEYTVTVKSRPRSVREAIINGLELWELMATAAKLPDAPLLRSVQSSLDELDWRRGMRFLREDNKSLEILASIKELDVAGLNESQLNVLGFMISIYSRDRKTTLEALEHLQSLAPDNYCLNMLQATELFSEGSLNANEKSNLLTTAIAPLRRAQNSCPKSPSPAALLSRVYAELGLRLASESEAEYASAILNPVAWEHLQLARQSKNDGDMETAIQEAEMAVEESPTMIQPLLELAKYRIQQKNDLKRDEVITRIVNLSSTDAEAMAIVLKIYEDLSGPSQFSAARRLIDPALSRRRALAWQAVVDFRENVTPEAYAQLSEESRYSGIDPLPLTAKAIRLFPNNSLLLRLHAINLVQNNADPDETISIINEAIQLDSLTDRWRMEMMLAITHARQGNIKAAISIYRQHILPSRRSSALDSDYFAFLFWYIRLANAYGFREEALHDLEIEPENAGRSSRPDDYLCAAWLHATLENEIAMKKSLSKSVQGLNRFGITPSNNSIYAHTCIGLGAHGHAQELINNLVEKLPGESRIWPVIATDAMNRGDIQLAKAASEKSVELALASENIGTEARTHTEGIRGLALLTSEEIEDAIACLEPLYKSCKSGFLYPPLPISWGHDLPLSSRYTGDYIRALLACNDLDIARTVCDEQVKSNPEDGDIHWARALIYLAEKNPTASIDSLQLAARLEPLNGIIELDWGRALIALGDVRAALPHLQKAVLMASLGRIRGYRPVAIEAAALAVIAAESDQLKGSQQAAIRSRSMQWLVDEINRQRDRLHGEDPLFQASAKQVLSAIASHRDTKETRERIGSKSITDAERKSWNELWASLESLVEESKSMTILNLEERMAHIVQRKQIQSRKFAEWVFAHHGQVLIQRTAESWLYKKISSNNQIPSDAFSLTGVSLNNVSITNKVLQEAEANPRISTLFLEGSSITDEAVPIILEKFPSVSLLNLDRTKITEASLPLIKKMMVISLKETTIPSAIIDDFVASRAEIAGAHVIWSPPLDTNISKTNTSSTPQNSALRFDGQESLYTKIERNSVLPTTIEAWVCFPSTMVTRYSYPLCGVSSNGGESMFALNINYRNLRGESRDAAKEVFNKKTSLIPFETWTHVAIVYDGQEMQSFVNGKLIDSVRFAIAPAELRYRIGGTGKGGVFNFEGGLDEVRISSTARYTTDFATALRYEPDEFTLALYHFDEGEGAIAHDASGNGHDLQLTGTTWVQRDE